MNAYPKENRFNPDIEMRPIENLEIKVIRVLGVCQRRFMDCMLLHLPETVGGNVLGMLN
jgi:hypothetical protein